MNFELEFGEEKVTVMMELFEETTNFEEAFKKFLEGDIPHLFIDPSYVFPKLSQNFILHFSGYFNKKRVDRSEQSPSLDGPFEKH